MGEEIVFLELERYGRDMRREKHASIQGMVDRMEPVFRKAGYRRGAGPENILVVTDQGIGDFVLLSPCLREIRQLLPDAHIVLVCRPRIGMLAEDCPYVDEVLFDVQDCDESDFMAVYDWNLGVAKSLLPYHFNCAFPFVLPLINRRLPFDEHCFHLVDQYLGLLEAYEGAHIRDRSLEAWVTSEDVARGQALLHDWLAGGCHIYGVGMGGSMWINRYPAGRYGRFSRLFMRKTRWHASSSWGRGMRMEAMRRRRWRSFPIPMSAAAS